MEVVVDGLPLSTEDTRGVALPLHQRAPTTRRDVLLLRGRGGGRGACRRRGGGQRRRKLLLLIHPLIAGTLLIVIIDIDTPLPVLPIPMSIPINLLRPLFSLACSAPASCVALSGRRWSRGGGRSVFGCLFSCLFAKEVKEGGFRVGWHDVVQYTFESSCGRMNVRNPLPFPVYSNNYVLSGSFRGHADVQCVWMGS